MLNLNNLESKLDSVLECETKKTLNKFLKEKRMKTIFELQLSNPKFKVEFYSESDYIELMKTYTNSDEKTIYHGNVEFISEDLCNLIVDKDFCQSANFNDILYIDYQTNRPIIFNSKESFLTLSELNYCIVSLL